MSAPQMLNLTPLSVDCAKALKKQYKFGYTVRNKQNTNDKLKADLDEYLAGHGIELPGDKKDFTRWKARIFQVEEYGDAMESRFKDLVNLRYALCQNRGYYAEFTGEGPGSRKKLQPLAFWYSKHRLDAVWNWRKSQIIRQKYYQFLKDAKDEKNRLLLDHYQPIHMVLTVPHTNGLWAGKRFYARSLMATFTKLRKLPLWNQFIYAGEYGLEVKKSAKHGLHIHIHSFILQNPQYSVSTVRDWIADEWKKLTGNSSDYTGIHYETLYTWQPGKKGKAVKKYIVPGKSDLKEYLAGVMECIKYHFKPDCLEKDETGEYDIQLIDEILTNTKGLRMYSRFGRFYNEGLLKFQNLDKVETDEEPTNEELEKDVLTTTDGVEERIYNPHTGRKAVRGEYSIVVAKPNNLKYLSKDCDLPYEPFVIGMANEPYMWKAPQGMSLKQVILLDVMPGAKATFLAATKNTAFYTANA